MSTTVVNCNIRQQHDEFTPNESQFPIRRKRTQRSPSALVVEEFIRTVKETAKIASVVGQLNALKAIATELFDSVVEVEVVTDPEIQGVRYLSIYVHAKGEVRSIASLRREWYRKVHGLLGENYDLVHLAIDVVE